MPEHNAWTRRQFLERSLTMASAAATMPLFLQHAAMAMRPGPDLTSTPGVPEDRVLVVVQLSGGNDGLNTVVPFGDRLYYTARRGIAIPENQAIKLSGADGLGLHPALNGIASLYDDGLASIVQGVGYPNPNRSHFTSMDIWHTADTSGVGAGWLGRFFDNQCHGSPAADARAQGQPTDDDADDAHLHDSPCSGHDALVIGREAPLALTGKRFKPTSFETLELFRWTGADLHDSLGPAYDTITGVEPTHDADAHPTPAGGDHDGHTDAHAPGSNAEFLTRTALDARVASDQIRRAVATPSMTRFPRSNLGVQMEMVASMIRAGLATRVYYVSMGGFDTHQGQGGAQGSHARLLARFGEAMKAFYDELRAQDNDRRVLTMVFSEFGRRVAQNGSGGTDHGTAAPMFLLGPMARAGVLGRHPSLNNLDNGDLRFTTDFRNVYAGVLEQWMNASSEAALNGRFRPANILRG